MNCHTVFFRECLKFCFMGVIQQELSQVKHRIRTYPNQECPSGWPNFVCVPENFGKLVAPVAEMDFNNVLSSDYYAYKSNFECVAEFEELSLCLMLAHNLTFPTNVEEARQFYDNLLSYISIIEISWVEGIRIIWNFCWKYYK